MTLLFMDGCHDGFPALKWNSGSAGTRSTSTPRFAGSAMYTSSTLTKTITPSAEVFTAHAHYWAGNSSPVANVAFAGDGGATTHITVTRNSSRILEVRRGTVAGTVLATGTTVLTDTTWQQIQVRCTVADSGGIVQVRLNGASTNEIDFLGDTKNGGTSTDIDTVFFGSTYGGYGVTDLAILNTAGSVNNTWPGDVRVQTLIPNADGNTSQGVGSDGNSVSNYLLVDETPYSSADYVGVTTDGQGDTYGLTDLTAGTNTVKGVQVNLLAAKSDAGAKSIKRRVRSGGTTYAGASQLLSASYATYSEMLEQDPATAATWTVSNVNALEAGFEAAT